MTLFSLLRNRYLSWSQNIPLPADLHVSPVFQSWHEFDAASGQWRVVPVNNTNTNTKHGEPEQKHHQRAIQNSPFVLVTWNVDSSSPLPAARISAIASHLATLTPAVDIIFLQEVSPEALRFLLSHQQIRHFWYSSEADETNWQGQFFASMTLLSKRRFIRHAEASSVIATLGPVWRLKYPSRFGRDALCCDIFLPSPAHLSSSAGETQYVRVRLVNVHLDSLPIQPSQRPQQISLIASVLRSTNCGLVAGDFNPVLADDATLIADNQLIDVWHELHPGDPGFTWGVDGQQTFPPSRLDKVALVGLQAHRIEVMHPEAVELPDQSRHTVPWSDHSGLRCILGLDTS
ncbi:hypothetical protein ED733_008036 [Metarhizium rileyi]|uniref:Endonuclease/exonuclease/phosphatase domain-containing protein n=1 Tax=Metarhizium rileyi (strain RCEF 4871) TaxID=1649241 RepID=A0A5C6GGZ2_METRR|nr:hypothetical protein ED733_008036 [Metarhizium rileyi]